MTSLSPERQNILKSERNKNISVYNMCCTMFVKLFKDVLKKPSKIKTVYKLLELTAVKLIMYV